MLLKGGVLWSGTRALLKGVLALRNVLIVHNPQPGALGQGEKMRIIWGEEVISIIKVSFLFPMGFQASSSSLICLDGPDLVTFRYHLRVRIVASSYTSHQSLSETSTTPKAT
jgi:hypothetical protein